MNTDDEYNSDWLYGPFGRELTEWERDDLSEAAQDLFHRGGMMCQGLTRYNFYRRKGHGKSDALAGALAWCRNSTEQGQRRLSHDTGAEGWKPPRFDVV